MTPVLTKSSANPPRNCGKNSAHKTMIITMASHVFKFQMFIGSCTHLVSISGQILMYRWLKWRFFFEKDFILSKNPQRKTSFRVCYIHPTGVSIISNIIQPSNHPRGFSFPMRDHTTSEAKALASKLGEMLSRNVTVRYVPETILVAKVGTRKCRSLGRY